MTERIPQSTAKRIVFKAYLASDHVTEATGKTIAITISKNGGAFGNPSAGATNATAISNGWYFVDLSTTDTNTLGPIAVRGAEATIDDVGVLLEIVSATSGGYTNLDAAVSSRLASASYTAPLDAAGTRAAVGLAAANLDTQLDALPTNAELATALSAADDAVLAAIAALSIPTAGQNATALLDLADGVEAGKTVRQGLRLMLAALAGKVSGADTTTVKIRDTNDTVDRITATVDANGNRSALTLNTA